MIELREEKNADFRSKFIWSHYFEIKKISLHTSETRTVHKTKKILKKKERERRAEIGSHTDDEMRCMHIFHLFFYILFLCFYVYV